MKKHALATAAVLIVLLVGASPVFAQGTLGPQGDITSVGATAGGGLTGGATRGPALLGLLTTCGTGEKLRWSGAAWVCSTGWTVDGSANTTQTGTLGVNQGADQAFTISARTGISFAAVPTFRPTKTDHPAALDVIPNGAPVENAGNGFAWLDVCDADILSATPPVRCARAGATSSFMEFGSRAFHGGTLLPLALTMDGASAVTVETDSDVSIAETLVVEGKANADTIRANHTGTGQTGNRHGVMGIMTGTFDTTSGAAFSTGLDAEVTSTRSAGGNDLWNIGVYSSASGAQQNYSGYFDAGSFLVNGPSTIDDTLTVTGPSVGSAIAATSTATGSGIAAVRGTSTLTAATGSARGMRAEVTGTADATAAGRDQYGFATAATVTRSAGANNVSNYAIYSEASGGQVNYSFFGAAGDLYQAANSVHGDSVTGDAHTINGSTTINGGSGAYTLKVADATTGHSTGWSGQVIDTTGSTIAGSSTSYGLKVTHALNCTGTEPSCNRYAGWFTSNGPNTGAGTRWALFTDEGEVEFNGDTTTDAAFRANGNTDLNNGVAIKRHIMIGNSAGVPSLSSCGSSPAVTGSDNFFKVVTGSGATGCVLTFAESWGASAPFCVISPADNTDVFGYSMTGSALTLTSTPAAATYYGHCAGYEEE